MAYLSRNFRYKKLIYLIIILGYISCSSVPKAQRSAQYLTVIDVSVSWAGLSPPALLGWDRDENHDGRKTP